VTITDKGEQIQFRRKAVISYVSGGRIVKMRKCTVLMAAGLISGIVFIGLSNSNAYAAGFGIFTQSSSATAQAAATTAHGDDPSVIFYNPALMSQLSGIQVEAGTTLIIPSREFKSALTGQTTKTDNQVFFPSTFYATYALTDRFSVGLGVFNPFGLGTKWPDNWEGRYIATDSKMTTFAFNPVASVKPAPWITVAGGVTYLTVDLTLERKSNFQAFGLPDGSQKFHATGGGFGFNVGTVISPCKNTDVGFTYRSKIRTSLDGSANFTFPVQLAPFVGPSSQSTDAATHLNMPAMATAGVYFKQFYPFTFELGTRWEQWSQFKELDINFSQPVAGTMGAVSPRNWHDTWAEMIGLKYQLSPSVALLAGYLYTQGAVPDSTFDPAIPDANSHYFSIGTDIKLKDVTIGAGYAYQVLLSRNKNNGIDDNALDGVTNPNTAANGSYKSHINLVALSVTYRF